MVSIKDYESSYKNQWCPGCGNFGILEAMKDALVSLEILPEKLLIVSGIGQAAKTPHFLKCNMFHALHGRALPLATGAKLANHDLKILVNSGDGDCYGEGGNHFMHAIRRNVDLTLLVHNNKTYGLTIDAERLVAIRHERYANSDYASRQQCEYELNKVEAMFRREAIPYLNTSSLSVEEISTRLLDISGLKRKMC